MNQIKYFYVGGDIHGDWQPIQKWIKNKLSTPIEQSALILLGDVGANYFEDYRDREFKKKLNDLGLIIYCIRGNHEKRVSDVVPFGNWSRIWDENCSGQVFIEQGYPNIKYLSDTGDIYIFNGKKALIVPGAYSVDKQYRLSVGWHWFNNEQLSKNEMDILFEKAFRIKDFDFILAHTCPESWETYIKDLFLNNVDQNLVDHTTGYFLNTLISTLNYNHFYFGHFHNDRDIVQVKATMLYKEILPLGDYLNEIKEI